MTVAASAESGGKLPYVTDAANLLTDELHMALEARAEEISQTYSFGIYIIAVNDYTNYSRESDFWDANVDIYETYDLGWGHGEGRRFLHDQHGGTGFLSAL